MQMSDNVTVTDVYRRLSRAAELNRGLYLSEEDVTLLGAAGALDTIGQLSMKELTALAARRMATKHGAKSEGP